MDEVVVLTVVSSRSEADLLVGLLRSGGLWAAVSADDAGGQEPQLQLQGVRVLVAASEEAPARQLLADTATATPGEDPDEDPDVPGGPERSPHR